MVNDWECMIFIVWWLLGHIFLSKKVNPNDWPFRKRERAHAYPKWQAGEGIFFGYWFMISFCLCYYWYLLLSRGVGENSPSEPYVRTSMPLLFKFLRRVAYYQVQLCLAGHRMAAPGSVGVYIWVGRVQWCPLGYIWVGGVHWHPPPPPAGPRTLVRLEVILPDGTQIGPSVRDPLHNDRGIEHMSTTILLTFSNALLTCFDMFVGVNLFFKRGVKGIIFFFFFG